MGDSSKMVIIFDPEQCDRTRGNFAADRDAVRKFLDTYRERDDARVITLTEVVRGGESGLRTAHAASQVDAEYNREAPRVRNIAAQGLQGIIKDGAAAAASSSSSPSVPAVERAAVERAAAQKAAAEKAAAEKAAAEKAAAEAQAAADKAAAEAAEEAAALAAFAAAEEKKAAERAEAERMAAERASAEKVAAEKAAAEKAAAEKAAAAKKAAATERAAAEKAAAEKAAAETAVADTAAAAASAGSRGGESLSSSFEVRPHRTPTPVSRDLHAPAHLSALPPGPSPSSVTHPLLIRYSSVTPSSAVPRPATPRCVCPPPAAFPSR